MMKKNSCHEILRYEVMTLFPHDLVCCSGDVAIALTDERGLDVPVHTTDNKDNTFRIDFEPTTVGTYSASVFFADQEIPTSPYKIKVEPSIDVSKVQVQGLDDSKSARVLGTETGY